MKRTLISAFIIVSLVFVGCGGKIEETTSVVTESGEMIEILTPSPGDTFSWAAVTGNAFVNKGLFYVELVSEEEEVLNRNSVELFTTAPDTVEFSTGISFNEDAPLQKAYIKAYVGEVAEDAAMFLVYILPSPAAAHAAIQRFYMALNEDDYVTAYDFVEPEGAAYPNFLEKEISFAARPEKTEDLASWKKEGEGLRVLSLRRLPKYALPGEDLFCYHAKIEHTTAETSTTEETYIFLKRQEDGLFLLYRPRKDMYKPDEE